MWSSKPTLFVASLIVVVLSFTYYPKWEKSGTEATISWDVSGYYWYLPAIFIYKDVKKLGFSQKILEKYSPTPDYQQATPHYSGNYVLKYSSGMALQYLPFFYAAHLAAKPLGFEADGFTKPYQFALQFGSVVMCLIGLIFFRKMLQPHFQDKTISILLICYVFATNYLDYCAIDNAMTHNWLFTWYCILLYATHRFYQKPSTPLSIVIGFTVGICTLTRPTDLISCLIPLFWGVNALSKSALLGRLSFILTHFRYFLPAIVVTAMVGSIQLFYWKYVSGEWFVYSYGDQSFSWLRPHFYAYTFKFRSGWLIYTPIMAFSWIGIYYLLKRKISTLAIISFILLNTYIVTAWDIWWYGGRAMVQSYPVLAFPFAAFFESLNAQRFKRYVFYALTGLFVFYNLWWTHGVHLGGLIDVDGMTQAYFGKVVGRLSVNPEYLKLYDTNEYFEGERANVKIIHRADFNADSCLLIAGKKINDSPAEFINHERDTTKAVEVPLSMGAAKWLRASATFRCVLKEWDKWRMAQFTVTFTQNGKEVKSKMIRLHRFLDNGNVKTLFFDTKLPKKPFDRVSVTVCNPGSPQELLMDDLVIEIFDEK